MRAYVRTIGLSIEKEFLGDKVVSMVITRALKEHGVEYVFGVVGSPSWSGGGGGLARRRGPIRGHEERRSREFNESTCSLHIVLYECSMSQQ